MSTASSTYAIQFRRHASGQWLDWGAHYPDADAAARALAHTRRTGFLDGTDVRIIERTVTEQVITEEIGGEKGAGDGTAD